MKTWFKYIQKHIKSEKWNVVGKENWIKNETFIIYKPAYIIVMYMNVTWNVRD